TSGSGRSTSVSKWARGTTSTWPGNTGRWSRNADTWRSSRTRSVGTSWATMSQNLQPGSRFPVDGVIGGRAYVRRFAVADDSPISLSGSPPETELPPAPAAAREQLQPALAVGPAKRRAAAAKVAAAFPRYLEAWASL